MGFLYILFRTVVFCLDVHVASKEYYVISRSRTLFVRVICKKLTFFKWRRSSKTLERVCSMSLRILLVLFVFQFSFNFLSFWKLIKKTVHYTNMVINKKYYKNYFCILLHVSLNSLNACYNVKPRKKCVDLEKLNTWLRKMHAWNTCDTWTIVLLREWRLLSINISWETHMLKSHARNKQGWLHNKISLK